MRKCVAALITITAVNAFPRMAANFSLIDSSMVTLSCAGTSTYDFQPTSTVYVTIDGVYTYTATANATAPSDILETPLPPCSSVIVPTLSTSTDITTTNASLSSSLYTPSSTTTGPVLITTTISYPTTVCASLSIASSTSITSNTTTTTFLNGPYTNSSITTSTASTSECHTTWTAYTTVITSHAGGPGHPQPLTPQESDATSLPGGKSSIVASSSSPLQGTFSGSVASSSVGAVPPKYSAVTVTVTKKTPVPVSIPVTSAGQNAPPPSITFPNAPTDTVSINSQLPPSLTQPSAPGNGPVSPTDAMSSGQRSTDGGSAGLSTSDGRSPATTTGIIFPSQSPGNNGPGAGSSANNNNNGSPAASTSSPGVGGLGSIINSAFNSPFTPVIVPVPVTTFQGAASATVTLVAGVPVQIGSSSVYIGGSNVVLPTGTSTALVTIAGQTFTVRPSAVVVGGSTLSITRSESTSYSDEKIQVATLAASTITNGRITVTVEPSAAILSGTTISIGLGARSTTVVVAGTTLTFNSNGVIFPSTTYAPAITTAPAYVVTTLGHITISIDSSEAIISGTTFRIGPGALNSATTTTIDGTTITFGPSGIVLPSTTLSPTAPDLTASETGRASAATRVVSDTATATGSGSAGVTLQRAPSWLSNTSCVMAMLIGLGVLPLSLIL